MGAQAYLDLSAALSFRFLVSHENLIVLRPTPSLLPLKEGISKKLSGLVLTSRY